MQIKLQKASLIPCIKGVKVLSLCIKKHIMTKSKETRDIKKRFNDLAFALGCKARLGGDARKIKFEMWTGELTKDGYEIVVGIPLNKFNKLVEPYPQLQDFE